MITLEMGKLVTQAECKIKLSAEIFHYYAKHAKSFLADKILNPVHGEAFIRHIPIGILLWVQLWNFTFYKVARFAAFNNGISTILLKHFSIIPQCTIAIKKIFFKSRTHLKYTPTHLFSEKEHKPKFRKPFSLSKTV